MNAGNRKAIFTGGLRTPFGRAFKGAYKEVRPDDLMIELFDAQSQRYANLWDRMPQDVVVGCAYPEGEQGYNFARMVSLGAGLEAPGVTVNRLCASSLEAVAIAAGRIAAGWGDGYLVGGIESMSRVARRGANFSESQKVKNSWPSAYVSMGETAENVASQYPHLDRARQEELAARSHTLAFEAFEKGCYADQIHPYLIERDEFIRVPVDREKMSSLKPAFRDNGVVTAATSSPLTDGATSGWVVSEQVAKECGVKYGLEIVDIAVAHVAPDVMGLGPVPATKIIFERNNIAATDVAAFEINEAFAIQVLASAEELNLPADRINTWGGAMAVGHPLGASGLRLVMTLHDRLRQQSEPGSLGIATLCVGGGQGMTILFRFVVFQIS